MTFSIFDYITIVHPLMILKLCIAIAILIFTRILIRALSPLIHDLCVRNQLDSHSCIILNKIIRYSLTIIGTSIALQNLGVDISMLIAAFGITGIVLSYGMKDIVANFIAGILIIGYKHIKINDYIKIKDWEGRVIDINLRYTTLSSNNTTIIIPNIKLYTETVAIVQN